MTTTYNMLIKALFALLLGISIVPSTAFAAEITTCDRLVAHPVDMNQYR